MKDRVALDMCGITLLCGIPRVPLSLLANQISPYSIPNLAMWARLQMFLISPTPISHEYSNKYCYNRSNYLIGYKINPWLLRLFFEIKFFILY